MKPMRPQSRFRKQCHTLYPIFSKRSMRTSIFAESRIGEMLGEVTETAVVALDVVRRFDGSGEERGEGRGDEAALRATGVNTFQKDDIRTSTSALTRHLQSEAESALRLSILRYSESRSTNPDSAIPH